MDTAAILWMSLAGLAIVFAAGCGTVTLADDAAGLSIGDGKAWSFFNGAWSDGRDGQLKPGGGSGEVGMQGHHYAFAKGAAYGDFTASFEIKLAGHSDTGLIFGATGQSRFHVLHFPNCGQAGRAQHFWAAVSTMDGDGYLRAAKLSMVRRVPSQSDLWLPVVATRQGNRLTVRINETGVFEVTDDTLVQPGRVGAYMFGPAAIRNLQVSGTEAADAPWDDAAAPPRNWSYPSHEREHGIWQRPGELIRTPGGDVLLNYQVQERPYQGTITPLTLRSTDNGRTWSKPQPSVPMGELDDGTNQWFWGKVHVFPDGKLRMLGPTETGYAIRETDDDGRTWSAPQAIKTGPKPPGLKKQPALGPQALLNLADGAVLMFGYHGHELPPPNANIWQWGSHHYQAFTCRSTDNGRTWTDWLNIDTPGKGIDGNMDLTEVCAAQLGNGRIMGFIRPIYSPWMWEATSLDNGKTWEPLVRGPFPGYATSNMLRTEAGAVLVAHRLPEMTIHTSFDDGLTFDQGTMIDSAIWVMGGMLEVEPNVVLYVYWDSNTTYMRSQRIRVGTDRIEPIAPSE